MEAPNDGPRVHVVYVVGRQHLIAPLGQGPEASCAEGVYC